MKTRKKIVLGIIVALVVVPLILFFFYPWQRNQFLVRLFIDYSVKQAQQRRVLLLCETDHQALLKAGREILSKVPPIENEITDIHTTGSLPFPKGMKLPQVIRELRPRGVIINHDDHLIYLIIEMHGGMDHFGVNIYPEDYKPPRHNYYGGNRELIPGLCYYDEGYSHPEYGKRIDALIEEYKRK